MGQNFLVDRNIRDIIVAAAAPASDDVCVEIGPGLGALTEALADRVAHLTAIEKDKKLFGFLTGRFAGCRNVRLIRADALDVDAGELLRPDGRTCTALVSNLPYSVASRLLVEIAESARRPARMVVTVQKEVADRLCATPGTADYGLLTLRIQLDYRVERVKTVSAACFWPRPAVRSEVVRLSLVDRRLAPAVRIALYEAVALAFTRRRKQILGSIAALPGRSIDSAAVALRAAGIAEGLRPEAIPLDDWIALACHLAGDPPSGPRVPTHA